MCDDCKPDTCATCHYGPDECSNPHQKDFAFPGKNGRCTRWVFGPKNESLTQQLVDKVSVLRLQKGDTVVFKVPRDQPPIPAGVLRMIGEKLSEVAGYTVCTLLLPDDHDISILRPDPAP